MKLIRHRAIATTVLLGSIITIGSFWVARESMLRDFREVFKNQAELRSTVLSERLKERLAELKATAGFCRSSNCREFKEFERFVAPFLEAGAGLALTQWVPCVPATGRALFEDDRRQRGMPGFQIYELNPAGGRRRAGSRPMYYPVCFVSPWRGNELAPGYDLGSEAAVKAVLDQARDTGEPVFSGQVLFGSERYFGRHCMVVTPVFREDPGMGDIANHRAQVKGFVLGVFSNEELIESVIRQTPPIGLPFDLLDLSKSGDGRLLYRHTPRLGRRMDFNDSSWTHPPEFRNVFTFAGKPLAFEIHPSSAYLERNLPKGYWAILPLGLSITATVALYLGMMIRQKNRTRDLAAQLFQTEERERRRIANDLHDGAGQVLATARMLLEDLRQHPDTKSVGRISALLGEAIQQLRMLTTDLCPPVLYELGLHAALELVCKKIQRDQPLAIVLESNLPDHQLDDHARAILYRSTVELLNNAVQHAAARNLRVTLRFEASSVRVVVEDDGKGFQMESRSVGKDQGFGLFSLRERMEHLHGRFTVESLPGKGTRATLTVPLKSEGQKG